MKIRIQRTLLVLVALVAASAARSQAPFSLDTSFHTNMVDHNVNAIHLLEDGKIFLSGRIRFPGEFYERSTARLYPDGQPDLPFASQYGGGGKIVPWVDGKFYVGTTTVRRRMSDGLIDPSFIAPQNSPYFQGGGGGGSDFHVFPDGRVLLSGASHTLSDTARGFVGNYDLIWFSNAGYLDTTRTHRNGNGAVYRFAELPDGRFICNGTGSTFEGLPVDRIFRVHADGAPDTTFQTGVFWGSAFTYLPLPDGRIYVAGRYRTSQSPGDTLHLARFLPDGTLDPTFNVPVFTNGNVDLSFGIGVTDILPWPGGRMLLAGQFRTVNGLPRKSICMIDTTGQVLDAFNECGVGTFSWEIYTDASIERLLLDTANNQLYLCGAYVGYDDGTTNDLEQRFVSRLHLGDIITGVQAVEERPSKYLTAHPNPADTWVALGHHVPGNTTALQLVVRDMAGRVLQTFTAGGEQGQTLWDIRGLAAGVHSVELLRDGRTLEVVRVVLEP